MSDANRARVVAVVLNYCREALTEACVASLEKERPALGIIVVDNDSPDGSGARLRARLPRHAVLQSGGNLGYSGGNNFGIRRAIESGAEYVLVINEDAETSPHCVATLVAALDAAPDAAVAVPTVMHFDQPSLVWWVDGVLDEMRGLALHRHFGAPIESLPPALKPGAPPREVDVISGCALLIRGSAFNQLGGFREDYINYLEDTELSFRWRRAGWKLLHVPSAQVLHKVAFPPPVPTPYQIRMRDRNRLKFAREFLAPAAKLKFHAWFWPTRIIHALRYAAGGDWARLRALTTGMLER